jgi:hypothetical protein
MWRNLLGRAAKTQSKPYKLFMYGIYNVVGSQNHLARTRGPRHLLAALRKQSELKYRLHVLSSSADVAG